MVSLIEDSIVVTAILKQLTQTANRNVAPLFALGLAAVAAYNWRQWRRDRALAERLRDERPPLPELARLPKVSVLVAAWNEGAGVDAHIQSFLALSYPNAELIVCAGGGDDTLARARLYECERVMVLEQRPGEGKQRALARCYERATGEIVYLTDADCRLDDEALARLLAPIVNEGEQVVTGSSRPLDEQVSRVLPAYLWATEIFSSAHSPIYIEGLLGRNTLITRAAIARSGGLDFAAPTGTDYHLARRVLGCGLRIRFVNGSVIRSNYPETARSYWHKQARWMRNLLIYGGQYGAYHQVGHTLQSTAVGLVMLCLPLFALIGMVWVLPFWVALVVHSVVSKSRYAAFGAYANNWVKPSGYIRALVPLTLLEFVIWVTPVFQSLRLKTRERW